VKPSAVSAPSATRQGSGARLVVARRGADCATLPQPGDTIGDKYSLVRMIGEGGMGVVFEAMHLRLRQRLAIKVVRPDVPEFDEVLARFDREARVAAKLRSIHSARVIDVDVLPNGLPYMVLEYLEGRDLGAELGETGPMPVEEAVDIALQVTGAMEEAHSLGIVHRDLKPSNLFVCRVAGRRVIKVLDFGISKHEGDGERITGSAAYFGTPHYTAPEQLRSASAADARSDVWSLGVILFELLTGKRPFHGDTLSEVAIKVTVEPAPPLRSLRPDAPAGLEGVISRCLEKDHGKRYGSVEELARFLQPFGPNGSRSTVERDR
jgi:eukaryotic-like serine/threonine-protein kinase